MQPVQAAARSTRTVEAPPAPPAPRTSRVREVRLILLAGGHVRQDFVTLMDVSSPAMLPYMGRPLVYITVLNFLKLGGRDVTVVIPEEEKRVDAFLRSSFGSRMSFTVVHAPNRIGATPLQSLHAALAAVTQDGTVDRPVLIAHGDIHFDVGSFEPGDRPVVFTSPYVDSDKYSSIHVTETGYAFQEAWAGKKPPLDEPLQAVARHTDIGLYYLPSASDAYDGLQDDRAPSASTVGGFLFGLYGGRIILREADAWTDLGHLDTSARIRTHLLGTREFNHLDIDEMRGLITKRGRNREKLLQEINYYNRLPKELTVYFPRMLESRLGKDVSYTIEYYGYKTLSEYLVFYQVPKAVWRQVLVKILAIHKAFTSRVEGGVDPERAYAFYWKKTEQRLGERSRLAAILPLLDAGEIVINGVRHAGWRACRATIQRRIRRIADRCTTTVIHGDLCCGNILYDPRTSLIKFIDPRGEFFEEGCHGDPRYDMAKLLHSFHGGYDFILHEMYHLEQVADGGFEMALLRSDSARDAEEVLFELIGGATGYDASELRILEALLFLTMLPLHCDDGKRQTALYLRGLMLLKEACGADLS